MIKHHGPISGVSCFKSKYIATAGYDNQLILWNSETHQSIARSNHDHLVNQCQFSPCGEFLVTASSDYTSRLWSVPNLKLCAVLTDHEDDVEMATFHPTEKIIATCSRDHKIRVFNFKGELIYKLVGHTADVISLQWSSCGDFLMSSSDDGTVKKWSHSKQSFVENILSGDVETDTLAISENNVIFMGDDEGRIHIYTGQNIKNQKAHKAGIKKLVYSSEHQLIVSMSYDRFIKIWKFNDNEIELIKEVEMPFQVWARALAIKSKNEIVCGTFGSKYLTYNFKVDHWDSSFYSDTEAVNAVLSLNNSIYTIGDAGILKKNKKVINQVLSLCNFLVTDQSQILTAGQTGEIFNLTENESIYKHLCPLNCGVYYKNNKNEDIFLMGTYKGEVLYLKKDDLKKYKVFHIFNLMKNAIKSLSYNIALNEILLVDASGALLILDSNDFEIKFKKERAHSKIANDCIALGHLGFASVSRDKNLYLWTSNHECEIIPSPVKNSIKCLSVNSNNYSEIAIGTYGGELATYDLKQKKWNRTNKISDAGLSDLIFDHNNNEFLVSDYNGEIHIYEAL